MNRAQLYHNMTTTELKDKYNSLKNELFNLRFQHSTGQVKNTDSLRIVRKDIAIVLTILNEREGNLPKNAGKATKPKKVTTGGAKK